MNHAKYYIKCFRRINKMKIVFVLLKKQSYPNNYFYYNSQFSMDNAMQFNKKCIFIVL